MISSGSQRGLRLPPPLEVRSDYHLLSHQEGVIVGEYTGVVQRRQDDLAFDSQYILTGGMRLRKVGMPSEEVGSWRKVEEG